MVTTITFQDSDRIIQKAKEKPNFCWNLMPPELKPNFKRAAVAKVVTGKPSLIKRRRPELTVDEKLKMLEEKEKVVGDGRPVDALKIKTDPTEEEEMEEDPAVEDDEMDDENDYGGNYFDNGEDFNDEDDNLDDGPVY